MLDRQTWQRLALLCASLACAGTAYAERAAVPLIGVLSMPALLAGTAGAGLALSFLPPREVPIVKLFGTVVFCALLGALGATSAVRVVADHLAAFAGPGAELLAAFVVGALGQVAIPLLVERRRDILARLIPKKDS